MHPTSLAVVMADSGRTLSHAELGERSARLARVLRDDGLRAGDGVALLADNAVECFEAQRTGHGLYLVPVDTALSLEEAAYVINDSEVRALIVAADRAEFASALVPLTPQVRARYVFGGSAEHHVSYEQAVGAGMRTESARSEAAPMLYSAGVTGRPKGVEPDAGRTDDIVAALRRLCVPGPQAVLFSPVPHSDPVAFHLNAAVHRAGGTVVTVSRFGPEAALDVIERHHVRLVHLVPAMVARLVGLPAGRRAAHDLSTVDRVVVSSAACPPAAVRTLAEWWDAEVIEVYGGAECPVVTAIGMAERAARPGSVGRPVAGGLRVCDQAGTELPPGHPGLVYVDGAPFRYHQAPERTAAARHPLWPGWMTLGDAGVVDERGFLHLMTPPAAEELLAAHPAVADVAVVSVPDESFGERIRAAVRPADGAQPGRRLAGELLELVGECGRVPDGIDFVGELPRTSTGKVILRKLLRRYTVAGSVIG